MTSNEFAHLYHHQQRTATDINHQAIHLAELAATRPTLRQRLAAWILGAQPPWVRQPVRILQPSVRATVQRPVTVAP